MGLSLTRRKGQRIIISHDIFVSYLDFRDDYTLILAIDCPRNIEVIHVEAGDALSAAKKGNPGFSRCFPLRLCQSILINKMIYLSPVHYEEGVVNFYIDAPKFVNIYREELLRKREKYS